jgi:hypothetical protein
MGEAIYIDIPGVSTHELPPLLVRGVPEGTLPREQVVGLATEIVDSEDMLSDDLSADSAEECKLNLAIHLTDQYFRLLSHWQWGDSILEWIRQCEITFASQDLLRGLLKKDLWPHAGRSSFVDLLVEKSIQPKQGVGLEKAVGMRLTFRQPPPIECFSNQFLFSLNSPLAESAYQTWSHMGAGTAAHFPPSRFHFEIHELGSVQ